MPPPMSTRACCRAFLSRPPSHRHVLHSCSSGRSMAHAALPISSAPSESCEAISPYPFKPYNLTPLGAVSHSPHHFTALSFSLPPNHLPHALNRLEGAILRLISHYPFLTGNVISPAEASLLSSDKSHAFEIQPVTASLMQHVPMLQTQHHPATSALSPLNHLPHTFLPFPTFSLPTEPSPSLRCKANVLGTRLVLVFGWDTRVMDPGAMFAVMNALAQFCRNPMAVREELPVSDPWAQAQIQHQRESGDVFSGLGLPSARHVRHWNEGPKGWEGMMRQPEPSSIPETRTARLNGGKVTMLTDACNLLVGRVAHDVFPGRLNQEDVVSALVGVCGSRARNPSGSYSTDTTTTAANKGTISVATDLRHISPLPTSATYMGNATVPIPIPARSNTLPPIEDSQMRSLLPDISPEDLYRICNGAVCLRGQINALEKGDEPNMSWNWDTEDPESGMRNSMQVHNMRPMDLYQDFGPLGRVRDVRVPGTRENGTCWLLPEREQDGGWDVEVTVEREAIEKLRKDRLVGWVVDAGGFW